MNFSFDASQVNPTIAYEPIPAGTYLAHIVETDVKPTQSGGQYLKTVFEVLEGPFKGRKIFNNLNIQNNNANTQKWALADLSAICHATGNIQLTDTSALHYKPMKIKVTISPPKGDFEASNRIKGYEAANSTGQVAHHAAPAANSAAPGAAAPAWAKKAA